MFLSASILSIAPIALILLYIFLRDKYEKEPLRFCLFLMVMGMVSVLPILAVELILDFFMETSWDGFVSSFWQAFFVAGLTEELFKFLILVLFTFNSKNFNEPMDGIVYAVFISLGFALVENILYVFENMDHYMIIGLMRAFTAVPAHAFFAVIMGFYFAQRKFYQKPLFIAFFLPFLAHGFYDFILFVYAYTEQSAYVIIFPFYMTFLLTISLQLIRKALKDSPFREKSY